MFIFKFGRYSCPDVVVEAEFKCGEENKSGKDLQKGEMKWQMRVARVCLFVFLFERNNLNVTSII